MVRPNPDKSAWWVKDSYDQEEVDQLLGKISKHGIAGLTLEERRRLEEAAERLKSL